VFGVVQRGVLISETKKYLCLLLLSATSICARTLSTFLEELQVDVIARPIKMTTSVFPISNISEPFLTSLFYFTSLLLSMSFFVRNVTV
jgi:hypothetical protein